MSLMCHGRVKNYCGLRGLSREDQEPGREQSDKKTSSLKEHSVNQPSEPQPVSDSLRSAETAGTSALCPAITTGFSRWEAEPAAVHHGSWLYVSIFNDGSLQHCFHFIKVTKWHKFCRAACFSATCYVWLRSNGHILGWQNHKESSLLFTAANLQC